MLLLQLLLSGMGNFDQPLTTPVRQKRSRALFAVQLCGLVGLCSVLLVELLLLAAAFFPPAARLHSWLAGRSAALWVRFRGRLSSVSAGRDHELILNLLQKVPTIRGFTHRACGRGHDLFNLVTQRELAKATQRFQAALDSRL